MSNLSKQTVITLIKVNCAVNDVLSQALKPHEVSIQQFNVLRILRGQKGVAANLSTFQERMVNRMSNTTRIIDKLIDKGFVERTICKKNRRKIELFITDKGLKMLDQIDQVVEQAEIQMTQNLSPEQQQKLVSLLKQINV